MTGIINRLSGRSGHAPTAAESEKSLAEKLRKLTVLLGKKLRAKLASPAPWWTASLTFSKNANRSPPTA